MDKTWRFKVYHLTAYLRSMRILAFSAFLFCGFSAFGQRLFSDVPAQGMGGAWATATDGPALFGNSAGMASVRSVNAMAGASVHFSLWELRSQWAGAVWPVKVGAAGIFAASYGFDTWRQQAIQVAFARSLLPGLRLGVRFDYLHTRIAGYGSKGRISGAVGLQTDISPQLSAGVHLSNPGRVQFSEGEYLPAAMRMGLHYTPSANVRLAADASKAEGHALRIRTGVEYRPARVLQLRIGFATEPSEFSAGMGLAVRPELHLDMAVSYHQVLGASPALLLRYSLSE